MKQHPTAARKVRAISTNVRAIEGGIARALDTLSLLTPSGWPAGGDAGGGRSSTPDSSPTANAACAGLNTRATRLRIDTLLTLLEHHSAELLGVVDEVRGLRADTTLEARRERCTGWGRHESTCERLGVTQPITLPDGRIVVLCDPCRQIRGRELRASERVNDSA